MTNTPTPEAITGTMNAKLTAGPTGFAAHCGDKHEDTLFSDRAEWVTHQRTEHRNTAARFRPEPAPKAYVSIGPKESEQLGRWVTDPRGKFGQIISLAPGRDRVWVSFGGSDIGGFGLSELTGAAAPAHTLSLLDPEPAPAPVAPVAAPVAPAPAAPAPVAPVAHWAGGELAVSVAEGVGWIAKCSCGWVGSERYAYESHAENAAIAHSAKLALAALAAPVAAAPAAVAPAPAPVAPVAPETHQAARPPKRRTPARPAAHARIGHAGPNGADVAAYWQSIEARYFAAIA